MFLCNDCRKSIIEVLGRDGNKMTAQLGGRSSGECETCGHTRSLRESRFTPVAAKAKK